MHTITKKACGILFCYNEELILKDCLNHYLAQGIDIVFVDNNSTDSSLAIVQKFQQHNDAKQGKVIDILNIETQGFEWKKMLNILCAYMHNKLSDYQWILLIDSDSFYYSPVKSLSLLEFMDQVNHAGCNIINGELHEFYPTEKDDSSVRSPLERLRYCQLYARPYYPQHKIFCYHPTVNFYTHSGHICLRENSRISPVKFIFNHYRWVSYEHALQKIFKDRNPRFVERSMSPEAHQQYLGILPIKEDLIKESCALRFYEHDSMLITETHFFWLMKIGFISKVVRVSGSFMRTIVAGLKNIRGVIINFIDLLTYNKRWIMRYNQELYEAVKSKFRKFQDYSHPPYKQVSIREIIQQEDVIYGLPENYHLLMTNFCNAQCAFCNQYHSGEAKKEIGFQNFLTILSHIPLTKRTFYFSGGGEPLLCQDLFRIIGHVNSAYPSTAVNIITNGLLIGEYAETLSRHKINQLVISVHGGSPEANNTGLQVNSYDVFNNLKLLNACLKKNKNNIHKVFSCVVSQRNINEVLSIIRMASQLDVKEVRVLFFRHHQYANIREMTFDEEDSLFFNKKKYNEVIVNAKKLAKKTGVSLVHDPLFFSTSIKRPCFQPWQNIVIDWDGNIYPCTGGESWFYNKVQAGTYYFGNLLKENLAQCWNNTMYVMIRRTCSRHYKRKWVPECKNCHNSLCFKGPDIEGGHLIRRHESGDAELQSYPDLCRRH